MELRKYQIEARDAAWSTLHDYEGPTVVTMPTGSGKSLIIAAIVELAATKHGGRVLCLCHRKELIRQNAEKIELITGQPCGIYSAGLKRRDTEHDVIVASIQSVYKRAEEFGKRHLIIVDEAHLISDNDASMYQRFFAVLNAKLIGLTATPFRCGTGPIAGKDRMFHSICYEKNVGEMIDAGWLCRLTNKPTMVVDTSDVKIRGGEFVPSSLELRFASDDIVDTACRQIVELTADRSSVLIFCAGVEHVYRVLDKLEQITDRPAGAVTGETPAIERDAILRRFDAGDMRDLVNC
ncbi:MAG: DEAD/DEAH box helicase, partial [Loktanella sp.]|nr:DEAD/DEAH box helicase [Loktanella sp.]